MDMTPTARLATRLAGRTFGTTKVLSTSNAHESVDVDGDPAIYIRVLLNDPADGWDTWPVDDVLALHRAARQIADDLGIRTPVYLHYRALTEDVGL